MEAKPSHARPMLGSGMAGQAADDLRLLKAYRVAQTDAAEKGEELPPFREWAKAFEVHEESGVREGFKKARGGR